MTKLMQDKLIELYHKKELLEIYTNKNNINKFSVGFIVALFEDEILLNSMDPYGNDDGFFIMRTKDIYTLSCETIYLKNLSLQNKEMRARLPVTNMENIFHENENPFFLILQRLKDEIITITLCYDLDVSGVVENVDNDMLVMREINESGNFDGFSYYYLADIERISFESAGEKKISKLFMQKL